MKTYTVSVPQSDGTILMWKFKTVSQDEAELLAGWKMYYQYQEHKK